MFCQACEQQVPGDSLFPWCRPCRREHVRTQGESATRQAREERVRTGAQHWMPKRGA